MEISTLKQHRCYMNKEINRPNDIFVNTILNPGANGRDLVLGGVNS
jgi:hypothetical protein